MSIGASVVSLYMDWQMIVLILNHDTQTEMESMFRLAFLLKMCEQDLLEIAL